jgi:ABC-type phosphate transport system substrate-binding protein
MKLALTPAALALAAILALYGGGAQAQMVIAASAKSTAPDLTKEQAAALYLGKASTLPGGGAVTLLDAADSSPNYEQFYAKLTGKSPAQVKATWAKLVFSGKATAPRPLPSSADIKKFLVSNPDAVGYIERAALDNSVKALLTLE